MILVREIQVRNGKEKSSLLCPLQWSALVIEGKPSDGTNLCMYSETEYFLL